MSSKQKTILVTGGAGFMGSNFVRYLKRKYRNCRVVVLDALTYAGNTENLPKLHNQNSDGSFAFWYGNVRNGELVDSVVSQANVVFHFAAETHVTRSIYDNLLFFETDVLGTAGGCQRRTEIFKDSRALHPYFDFRSLRYRAIRSHG